MISIEQTPVRIVDSTSAYLQSKWNAVHNPIRYYFQRVDYEIDTAQFSNVTNLITISILGTAAHAECSVGDTIYFKSGYYQGVSTIASKAIVSGDSVFTLTFSSGSTGLQSGGVFNLNSSRENYYQLTKIIAKYRPTGADVEAGISINKPDYTGLITVDVSTFMKSMVGYTNIFDYANTNTADYTLSCPYNIVWSENYSGIVGDFTTEDDNLLFYVTNSAKQIQDKYGENMGEYVPFKAYATGDKRAKFLCDFEVPTFFNGLPFSLSFIYSENIADPLAPFDVYKNERTLDINGSTLATSSVTLQAVQAGMTNRSIMELQVYAANVSYLDVWLQTLNSDITPILVDVTEVKRVKVDTGCFKNVVYLCWLNALGGWSYWCFHGKNTRSVTTESGGEYYKYEPALETAIGSAAYQSKLSQPQIICGANVSMRDMDGLSGLFESPFVFMLMNPETWTDSVPIWQRVKIPPGFYDTKVAGANRMDVEIVILTPEKNIQSE